VFGAHSALTSAHSVLSVIFLDNQDFKNENKATVLNEALSLSKVSPRTALTLPVLHLSCIVENLLWFRQLKGTFSRKSF
jgi:hypothetical protein